MLNRWEPWFAWRPVWVSGHGPVWLMRVERMKRIRYSLSGGVGEYPGERIVTRYRVVTEESESGTPCATCGGRGFTVGPGGLAGESETCSTCGGVGHVEVLDIPRFLRKGTD